jgi:serine-type D-Ala-D-Ala carboxypeptidase (penicillin-binding protein 5/6)
VRIAGGLATAAVVAGMIIAVGAEAPAAEAAQSAVQGAAVSSLPAVNAAEAELVNAAGPYLWSKSSTVERPIGSITKVMTAYVVLTTPGLNLQRSITVPSGITAYDREYGASTAGLVPGERYTVAQLLYAMMLPSGCDASYTLANAFGPGINGFVAKMNAAAKSLHMTRTHFADPSGLPVGGEYATYSDANDLILLGRAAMKNNRFATVVAARSYSVAGSGAHRAHTWTNLNPLLGHYSGAVGIKTGYTGAAGQCLLFEARRGSTALLGVVLDSSSVDSVTLSAAGADATTMLNWGFSR